MFCGHLSHGWCGFNVDVWNKMKRNVYTHLTMFTSCIHISVGKWFHDMMWGQNKMNSYLVHALTILIFYHSLPRLCCCTPTMNIPQSGKKRGGWNKRVCWTTWVYANANIFSTLFSVQIFYKFSNYFEYYWIFTNLYTNFLAFIFVTSMNIYIVVMHIKVSLTCFI